MSLATKYRPSTFEEVVGQDTAVKILRGQSAKDTESRHHTLLLWGQKGTGKTSAARIYANILVEGNTENIYELDAASNRGIDEVRRIQEMCTFAPMFGRSRVFILDEAHQLTPQAFDALLKLLEEADKYTYFMLCTTQLRKIPETVRTRCLQIPFKWVKQSETERKLAEIATNEDIDIEQKGLKLIARTAEGSLRQAIATLEALSSAGETVTYDDVLTFVGAVDSQYVESLYKHIVDNDIVELIRLISDLRQENNFDLVILQQLYRFVETVLYFKVEAKTSLAESIKWKYEQLAKSVSEAKLYGILITLGDSIDRQPAYDSQIYLQTVLLKLASGVA